MNVLLFVFAALSVASVYCAFCPTNNINDCSTLICGQNFHKDCVNGICTCNANADHMCRMQTDCYQLYFNNTLAFCDNVWHCIDNRCRCGGNFGR